MDTATFGAGCFWCIEAHYQLLNGVNNVSSGYMGGVIDNPSYQEVCSGKSGHAEVTQITFDSTIISFSELLSVFWRIHDPTQLNRQGNDIGSQYRSVIFFHNQTQEELAKKYKKELEDSAIWDKSIVTEISPLATFYSAEEYHQDYYSLNPDASYCKYVIQPKIEKFEKIFKSKLKSH